MSAPRQEEGWTPRWLFPQQLSFASEVSYHRLEAAGLCLSWTTLCPQCWVPLGSDIQCDPVFKKMPSIVHVFFLGGFEGHWLLRAGGFKERKK